MTDILVKPSQGYLLITTEAVTSKFSHELCGTTALKGAISPNSGRPLLQLLALDMDDPRLELQSTDIRVLPLLYSWTCPISQGIFSYQVSAKTVEVKQFSGGTPYSDFPYVGYPEYFCSRPIDLSPLTFVQQEAINRLNSEELLEEQETEVGLHDLDRPRHQIGGIPRLMQVPNKLCCPTCKLPMPIIASVANDNGTPLGFANNPFVQVIYHFCVSCLTVSCYNIVD